MKSTNWCGSAARLMMDQHAHRLTCGDMPCGRHVVAVSEDGARRRESVRMAGHSAPESWQLGLERDGRGPIRARIVRVASRWRASTSASSLRRRAAASASCSRSRAAATGGGLTFPTLWPVARMWRATASTGAFPLSTAADPATLLVGHPHAAVVVGLVALAAGHRRITTGRRGSRRSSRSRGRAVQLPAASQVLHARRRPGTGACGCRKQCRAALTRVSTFPGRWLDPRAVGHDRLSSRSDSPT
jgi:hypothetical protein